jgi:hypothetical protein
MRCSAIFAVLAVFSLCVSPCSAWEANYPSGPVRKSTEDESKRANILVRLPPAPKKDTSFSADLDSLRELTSNSALSSRNDPTFAGLFSRRTVAYPTPDGIGLGHGWDFLSNQKTFSSCVQFQKIEDNKYQTVDSRIQQTIDEETLDISLNTSFSASASGTIEVVKASGEAKFSLNASHHMSTSDTTFMAHESATNGVVYAGPTKDGGVMLRPDMAKLDPESFREKCGDGFVASIGMGADLYIMIHAHDLTTEDKVDLETSAKASAGVADVFSGSASGSFSTKIDDLIKKHSLDIEFVQQGGIFTMVPTNLDEAKKKVQTFMGEEKEGPRSLFVTLVPYSELPNWRGMFLLDTSDMRQRAIRYFQRLQSVLYEVRNIRENYFRENGVKGDKYLFDYAHQLRKEDLTGVSEKVREDMNHVDELLKILDGKDCKSKPVAADSSKGLAALGKGQRECNKQVAAKLKEMDRFNDFRFWIRLPLPLDAISEKERQFITDVNNTPPHTLTERQRKFKQDLYRYWVERTDQLRCRLFFECLNKKEQEDQYKDIESTIPNNPGAVRNLVGIR